MDVEAEVIVERERENKVDDNGRNKIRGAGFSPTLHLNSFLLYGIHLYL
jgi:hypothetical protein